MMGGPPGYGCGPCGVQIGGQVAEVFVDVSPLIQPTMNRGPDGCLVMDLPPIRVQLSTTCTLPLPAEAGLAPFKPFEEFFVTLPEVSRVVFDPARGMPPNATATAQTRKRGAVLEAPSSVTIQAKLKANSPFGSLVLEESQVMNGMKQKIGETTLNYRLQVDGQLVVNRGAGNYGSNRLEVDLSFSFTCSVNNFTPMGPMGPMG